MAQNYIIGKENYELMRTIEIEYKEINNLAKRNFELLQANKDELRITIMHKKKANKATNCILKLKLFWGFIWLKLKFWRWKLWNQILKKWGFRRTWTFRRKQWVFWQCEFRWIIISVIINEDWINTEFIVNRQSLKVFLK